MLTRALLYERSADLPPEPNAPDAALERPESLLDVFDRLASTQTEGMTLGALMQALGDRAVAAALFALALPCCIPFLYIVPQLVALPMAFFALQMALGRRGLWLPETFAKRLIPHKSLEDIAKGGRRFFGWVEAIVKPRFTAITGPLSERVVGVFLVVFCASVLTPLPATNTVPGFAVALTAFGLMERDGLLVIGGVALGALWVTALLAAFLFGLGFLTSVIA